MRKIAKIVLKELGCAPGALVMTFVSSRQAGTPSTRKLEVVPILDVKP
jgi:hypothetical protein